MNPVSAPEPDLQRKRCFAPVVDARTTLLILGSLPGEKSLALQEYYGNRQNRFWALMSEVTGVRLVPLAYPERLQALRARGVGLWDVVAEARRPGSLDSQIRAHAGNDLVALAQRLPALRAIAFNGGTAARLGRKALGEPVSGLALVDLPSSSPAYTLAYLEKLSAWRPLSHYLD